jgi:predicted transcriptional regulator
MPELQFDHPVPELSDREDEKTLAAIERGVKDCENGRNFSLEEVRRHMEQWLSNSSSRSNQ